MIGAERQRGKRQEGVKDRFQGFVAAVLEEEVAGADFPSLSEEDATWVFGVGAEAAGGVDVSVFSGAEALLVVPADEIGGCGGAGAAPEG